MMTYHYIVGCDNMVLAVLGRLARALADELARDFRGLGVSCRVVAQGGERQVVGSMFKERVGAQ